MPREKKAPAITVDSISVVAPMGEAAAAAPAKEDEKQTTKAEAKLDMAKSKAKERAIVAEKRSQYLGDKAAPEAAVMAEVRARMHPIAVAEERRLDSKEQDEAVTADCIGKSAGLRVFSLGKRLNMGRFGGGYVHGGLGVRLRSPSRSRGLRGLRQRRRGI